MTILSTSRFSGPQRHANADLVRASAETRIGNRSQDTDRGKRQRHKPEGPEEPGIKARLKNGPRKKLLHRGDSFRARLTIRTDCAAARMAGDLA